MRLAGHGQAAVLPVVQVVHLEEPPLRAQRMGATLVATLQRPAQGSTHRALGGVDPDHLAHPVAGHHHLGVAGLGSGRRHRAAPAPGGADPDRSGLPDRRRLASTTLLRSPRRPVRCSVGVERVGRLRGHADQRVGLRDRARGASCSPHAVERGVGLEALAVAELGVACARRGPLRSTAPSSGGRQNRPPSQPPSSVHVSNRRRNRCVAADRAPARRSGGQDGEGAVELADEQPRAPARRPPRRASAGTRRAIRTIAYIREPPRLEECEAAGQIRGSGERWWPGCRPGETTSPAFHDTQCSTERMPVPPHPSVSINMRIVRTSRATAALIVPMTATVSPLRPPLQACSCGATTIVMPTTLRSGV